MSKMSELSQVLDDLISCGEKMIQTANAIRECFSEEEAPAAETKKKPLNRKSLPTQRKMSEHFLLPRQTKPVVSTRLR